jgi:uncharacterized protein
MDARNPDLSRPRLLAECGLVLMIAWVPLMVGGRLVQSEVAPDAGLQLYYILALLAPTLLLHYLVWRNGESFRHLAWRPLRPFRELLWAGLIFVALWIATLVDLALLGPFSGGSTPSIGSPGLLLTLQLLVAAVFEEVLYRGYLWNRFRRLSRSPALTMVATSVFFTATHPYPLRDLSSVFCFGLLMGAFRLQGRSLARLILAHWSYNLVLLLP